MFSSEVFLFLFLPIVLIVYYLLPKKVKNVWLLISSIIFYTFNSAIYVILFIMCILLNYFMAIIIDSYIDKVKKILFILTLIINISILCYFKYTMTAVSFINNYLGDNISGIDLITGRNFLLYVSRNIIYY